jgi:hypothetical protein
MRACARPEFPRRDATRRLAAILAADVVCILTGIGDGGKAQPGQQAAAEQLSTMSALRRLRSSDRRAAFGLAIGGLIWQSSVEPTIESLRDRWTRVPAGVDGAKAAAPHLKLGTAFRFVHHGPGVAGRVLVAARAGAIWLGRQC